MNATIAALETAVAETAAVDIRSAFKNDPHRFRTFSISLDDLLLDF